MIDEQHKQWFDKAEALFDAGRKGQAKEYIGELLQFLDDYTRSILRTRRYMLKINYRVMMSRKRRIQAIGQLKLRRL